MPRLSRKAPISAWMYRPTPVAAPSPSARVSIATTSLWRPEPTGSGVSIDPRLLREGLQHPPGGEAFEIVGPQGHDAITNRRDVGLAGGGEHQRAGGRRDVERIAIVPDDAKAELAEHGHLVRRHVSELERKGGLGDAGPRLADGLLIAGSTQDHDAFRRRLVGHHGKAFRRPARRAPLG